MGSPRRSSGRPEGQSLWPRWEQHNPSDRRSIDHGAWDALLRKYLDAREQQSCWINLYNALTVKVILDHYPVKSIRTIKPDFLSLGPWDVKLGPAAPLCRELREPGLSHLAEMAYAGESLDRLLTEGAVAYVNHPRGASIRNRRLDYSYDWEINEP